MSPPGNCALPKVGSQANDTSLANGGYNVVNNAAELTLSDGADPQQVLAAAMGKVRIRRFELGTPSLEKIFIDQVGTNDPGKPEIKFQAEKLNKWRSKGARPSETVAQLIRQAGVDSPPA